MIKLIVFDGNSLTQSRGGVTAYPDLIDLTQTPACNMSVGGATTVEQDARALELIDPLLRPGGDNWIVMWEGTNDLYFGATAHEAIEHLKDYCTHRRAAGFKVMLLTLLPRSDAGRPPMHEANRQIVNAWLRSAAGDAAADLIIDVAADPWMGHVGQEFDERFYLPDRVHLAGAGAYTIAGYVARAIDGKV